MEKKQCTKCKEWKNLDCFDNHKHKKDGLHYQCKKCRKDYYEEHKDDIKQYRENNKERELKRSKQYREDNKENRSKINKIYNNSPVKFDSKVKFRQDIELYEEVRESKDGYLQCKCVYCGDWFTPTYKNINNRLIAMNYEGQGEGRLYCSESCKYACPTYGQKLYPKGFKEATSREVQPELRQMVLARDNYTCQRCDKHKEELSEEGIALHCHHLEGILWEPLMSADMDQCITYCQPCHVKAHQGPDCGYHDQQCK